MEINYALIGKRIRETRKQRGLSAEELAEIADLSTVYISYIENAKRKPSLESLIKISNALEITIDELLYGNLLYNPTEYQTDIRYIYNCYIVHIIACNISSASSPRTSPTMMRSGRIRRLARIRSRMEISCEPSRFSTLVSRLTRFVTWRI